MLGRYCADTGDIEAIVTYSRIIWLAIILTPVAAMAYVAWQQWMAGILW